MYEAGLDLNESIQIGKGKMKTHDLKDCVHATITEFVPGQSQSRYASGDELGAVQGNIFLSGQKRH